MAKALFSLVVVALLMFALCTSAASAGRVSGLKTGDTIKYRSIHAEMQKLGAIPKVVDWRKSGAVTPVTGSNSECSADVALAVAANIEGLAAVKTGKLVAVSSQELIDCATGCMGAYMSTPYDFLMNHTSGAVATNKSWPFTGNKGKCDHRSEAGAVITDFYTIDKDEATMAAAVAHRGPIVVSINALPLELYTSGVLQDCSPDQVDQAVAVVGYNMEDKKPYWIIKNVWGPDWGMEGYAYLYYGNNTCGITTMPTTAVLNSNFH